MEKNYKIHFEGFENLDEKTLGMLIDSLVGLYQTKYGIELHIEDDEPELPEYEFENTDLAKHYLQKYRLNDSKN